MKAGPSARAVRSRALAYMRQRAQRDGFMGSMLVAAGGRVIARGAWGMASIEHGVRATPGTKYRIGSLTKQFTAAALLKLAAAGKLQVEDPVRKYVRRWPREWKGVTLHHLLCHASGLPDFLSLPDIAERWVHPYPPGKSIGLVLGKPPLARPGEKFAYSGGTNYILLGMIIETVSGQSYAEYLGRTIWEPLGMEDTGCDDGRTIVNGLASGYTRHERGLAHAAYVDMVMPFSAGGLYSTVEDMFRWDRGLAAGRFIKKSRLARMFTPNQGGYGYGFFIGSRHGQVVHSHTGHIQGFAAHFLRFPEADACVVTMRNTDNTPAFEGICHDLAAILFGEECRPSPEGGTTTQPPGRSAGTGAPAEPLQRSPERRAGGRG